MTWLHSPPIVRDNEVLIAGCVVLSVLATLGILLIMERPHDDN